MADDTPTNGTADPNAAANAAAESARLFGQPDPNATAPSTAAPALPEGYVEKYWQAARGNPEEYAKVLSEGYRQLNGTYTQITQSLGEDKPGEVADAYWAERPKADFEKAYPKLSFEDEEAVRDIYRAAHAQGLGPKRANALVDHYLASRNKAAPDVESDEDRRSRVIHEMGVQGAAKASAVATWIHGMGLDAAQIGALAPVAESAAGMEALFRMSRASLAAPPAGGEGTLAQPADTRAAEIAQLKADLADPEKGHTAEVRARYLRLVKDGHTLDGEPLPQVG